MYFKNNVKGSVKRLLIVSVLLLSIVLCSVSEIRLDQQYNFSKELPILRDVTMSEIEIPEGLVDIEVDTLLTNDFRINIHNMTTDQRIYHVENKENTVVKNIYKGIEADLKIFYKRQLIFDQNINKSFFKQQEESSFWDKAILQTVEVDELKSIDKPLIWIRFYNPTLDVSKAYEIQVDSKGVYTLQIIDHTHIS
ncbi:hypothetical protein [Galbibacter sp.]|jgi:hypothetical protein|uniref:hypothetical protein n=1 Tax=Galbibacter sp. TaxID=2918471 RepID=UPI003A93D246